MIITIITTVAAPTLEYGNMPFLAVTLYLCGFYGIFYAIGISMPFNLGTRKFWLGFTTFMMITFCSQLPIAYAIKNDSIFLIGVLIGIISLIGLVLIYKIIPKRTKYGIEIFGKMNQDKTS